MGSDGQGTTWVTIAEAAPILGCSVDTVRRRLKRGELEARQVHTQHGPTWEVCLGNVRGDMPTVGSTPRQAAGSADGAAILEALRLVGRLQEENRTLAGQVGYLQAQLDQAREQLRALEAPKTHESHEDVNLTAQAPEPPTTTPPDPPSEPVPVPTPAPIPPGPKGDGPWWRRWWAALVGV